MPLRSQNRRRFEVVAGGHPGSCGRVAVLNGRNVALGQTDTFGQELSVAPSENRRWDALRLGLASAKGHATSGGASQS